MANEDGIPSQQYKYAWSPDSPQIPTHLLAQQYKPSMVQNEGDNPWIWVQKNTPEEPENLDEDAAIAEGKTILSALTARVEEIKNDSSIPARSSKGTAKKAAVAGKKEVREAAQAEATENLNAVAVKHGFVSGKWLSFATTDKVDMIFNNIATSLIQGPLSKTDAFCIKVATSEEGKSQHLVCIYVPDIYDKEALARVMRVLLGEHGMALSGVKSNLYTALKIDSKHPSGIQSTTWKNANIIPDDEAKQLRDGFYEDLAAEKDEAKVQKTLAKAKAAAAAKEKPQLKKKTEDDPFGDDDEEEEEDEEEAQRKAELKAKTKPVSKNKRPKSVSDEEDESEDERPKKKRATVFLLSAHHTADTTALFTNIHEPSLDALPSPSPSLPSPTPTQRAPVMMSEVESTPVQNIQGQFSRINRQYQQLLDRWTPHTLNRWLATGALLLVFFLRIVLAQGWYIVCYAHAIYLLNLLLAFLQPKFDPSLQEDLMADDAEGGTNDTSPLPSSRDDEFRPFVRRLPEWQFWLSTTRATVVALFCTLSEAFDVPVYWPILVVYFFVLFALTMRRQIQHMVKYKYVPFDIGRKARYGSNK
ncbi:Protein RER1 [Mycena kentingensis (nom. inval.)]|nr:Protein RER1 [Mycena kentingensis (nom. inval.)]